MVLWPVDGDFTNFAYGELRTVGVLTDTALSPAV